MKRSRFKKTSGRPVLTHGPVMRSVIAGYVILAVGVTIGLYGAWHNSRANRQAVVRVTRLSQSLCQVYSVARVRGNKEVRKPLRIALLAQARTLELAAKDPGNATKQRREYARTAQVLRRTAAGVSQTGPVPCEFR